MKYFFTYVMLSKEGVLTPHIAEFTVSADAIETRRLVRSGAQVSALRYCSPVVADDPGKHAPTTAEVAVDDEPLAAVDRSPAPVAEYFYAQLGENLESRPKQVTTGSPFHPAFHIETQCGRGCKEVIDAAAVLATKSRAERIGKADEIVETARRLCLIYIHG